jgi:hypothetical protein
MSAYNQPSPYHQGHKPTKKDELLNGLSVSVALYLTLWAWPAFYGFTVTYAETHIIENFGYEFLFVGKIAHGLAVGAVTYFGLRLAMWTALSMLTVATAKNGFGLNSMFNFLPI